MDVTVQYLGIHYENHGAIAVIDIWGHKLVFYGFSYISKVQLNELAVHFCTIKYTIIHPSNQGDINKTSMLYTLCSTGIQQQAFFGK